jgi:hypothetical protein
MSSAQVDKKPAGKCPEHGVVTGDDVEFRFPVGARCSVDGCGLELEVAGLATPSEIAAFGGENG